MKNSKENTSNFFLQKCFEFLKLSLPKMALNISKTNFSGVKLNALDLSKNITA